MPHIPRLLRNIDARTYAQAASFVRTRNKIHARVFLISEERAFIASARSIHARELRKYSYSSRENTISFRVQNSNDSPHLSGLSLISTETTTLID